MWILIPHNDVATAVQEERIQSQNLGLTLQKSFLLLPDADNVVGRLPKPPSPNSSSSALRPFRPIAIAELSISGSHASLNFDQLASIENPQDKPEVTLTDRSSFGTWVNGKKVHKATQRLNDGDLIEFGGNRLVKFHLRHRPLVVTISAISDAAAKAALVAAVAKLGGHVISDWRRDVSTHCCMETIAVTIKTISAMVALKPVVTPAYFDAFLTAALKEVDASIAPPDEEDFLPEVSDSQLTGRSDVSFHVDPARARVFAGKTLYFFDRKQFKKCFAVAEIGGGKTKLIEDAETMKLSMEAMVREDAVVMEPSFEKSSQAFCEEVMKALEKKNLRWIGTPEIGYAIIYASTRLFVNPSVMNPMEIWMMRGEDAAAAAAGAGGESEAATSKDKIPAVTKTSEVSTATKLTSDESSSFGRKETRMDSIPSSSTMTAAAAAISAATPASVAEKRPLNIFASPSTVSPPSAPAIGVSITSSAARDSVPSFASPVVVPDSYVVPSTVPCQDVPSAASNLAGGGVGAATSTLAKAALKVEASSNPTGAGSDLTTQSKSTVKQSSVLKRILWADSDDEEEDEDGEPERKKIKTKLEKEKETEAKKKRDAEEKDREEKEMEKEERKRKEAEEEVRRKKQKEAEEKERKKQKEAEEEERKRRKEVEEEERKRRKDVEEEERRRQKEVVEKERKRQKEAEEEAWKRRKEAEEEVERKKRRKSDDDFSDLDVDDLDEMERKRRASVTAERSVDGGSGNCEGNTAFEVIERPATRVKVEAPTSQLAEGPTEDGWIKKPDKSRNWTNGIGKNGLANGHRLSDGISSLSLEMMVEEVNLVVRRAAVPTPFGGRRDVGAAGANAEGARPVKNFKRFKRSARRDCQDISRMVVDLVPVAMNATPPERFEPNLPSSSVSFNQTESSSRQINSSFNPYNRTASSSSSSSSTSRNHSSNIVVNGGDSRMGSSNSAFNGDGASRPSTSSNGSSRAQAHPNFDVDIFNDDVGIHGRHHQEQSRQTQEERQHVQQPQPPQPQPATASNQPTDEFFDFDF